MDWKGLLAQNWKKIGIFIIAVLALGVLYIILTGRLASNACIQPPCYATGVAISSCSVLDRAGEVYHLAADITDTSSGASGVGQFNGTACMHVTAANVTLDCHGHLIDGVDIYQETYGVYSEQFNTTVRNCVFTDWNNPVIWFNIADSEGSISNVTYSRTQNGIFLYNVNNVVIKGITAYSNDIAMAYLGNNITLRDSRIYDNGGFGIVVNGMNGGLIFNNLFNNSANVQWVAGDNRWNSTNQPGTPIYGSGTQTGGNYWGNPAHTGYSDTCKDADNDGFCDEPYDASSGVSCKAGLNCSGNADHLPLSGR